MISEIIASILSVLLKGADADVYRCAEEEYEAPSVVSVWRMNTLRTVPLVGIEVGTGSR